MDELLPAPIESEIRANAERGVEAFLDLDHYRLKQIEDVREGNDLFLRIQGYVAGGSRVQTYVRDIGGREFQLEFRKAKSDWVEKILPFLWLVFWVGFILYPRKHGVPFP